MHSIQFNCNRNKISSSLFIFNTVSPFSFSFNKILSSVVERRDGQEKKITRLILHDKN